MCCVCVSLVDLGITKSLSLRTRAVVVLSLVAVVVAECTQVKS